MWVPAHFQALPLAEVGGWAGREGTETPCFEPPDAACQAVGRAQGSVHLQGWGHIFQTVEEDGGASVQGRSGLCWLPDACGVGLALHVGMLLCWAAVFQGEGQLRPQCRIQTRGPGRASEGCLSLHLPGRGASPLWESRYFQFELRNLRPS